MQQLHATAIPEPNKDERVSIDHQACVMYDEDKFAIYCYEEVIGPEDARWVLNTQFEEDTLPPLDFINATHEIENNDSESAATTIVTYAADISMSGDDGTSTGDSQNDHWIKIDGNRIPETGSYQDQYASMVAGVDHLIEQHDLLDHIQLPYTPTWARGNCSINVVAEHPDESEMDGAKKLSSGDYLFTGLNKGAKRKRFKDLADHVNAEVEFNEEWLE